MLMSDVKLRPCNQLAKCFYYVCQIVDFKNINVLILNTYHYLKSVQCLKLDVLQIRGNETLSLLAGKLAPCSGLRK